MMSSRGIIIGSLQMPCNLKFLHVLTQNVVTLAILTCFLEKCYLFSNCDELRVKKPPSAPIEQARLKL